MKKLMRQTNKSWLKCVSLFWNLQQKVVPFTQFPLGFWRPAWTVSFRSLPTLLMSLLNRAPCVMSQAGYCYSSFEKAKPRLKHAQKLQTCVQSPIYWKNNWKGFFNSTTKTPQSQWSSWDLSVCTQERTQHRNSTACCHWQQVSIHSCFPWSLCCVWHPWPQDSVEKTEYYLRNSCKSASVVFILSVRPPTACHHWKHLFKTCSTSVWSSPKVCTGPHSVHPVHSASL